MLVVPAFGILQQEDCYTFRANLGYIPRPCLEKKKKKTLIFLEDFGIKSHLLNYIITIGPNKQNIMGCNL